MHPLYERANKLTDEVIAAAIEVHKHFGDGLLESIYVRCLDRALRVAGHKVEHEKVVPITYLGETFEEKLILMTRRLRGLVPKILTMSYGL